MVQATAANYNPYHPAAYVTFLGTVRGTVGGVGADTLALVVDPATGDVGFERVTTGSVREGALNAASWTTQTSSTISTTSGGSWLSTMVVEEIEGDTVQIDLALGVNVVAEGATQGEIFTFEWGVLRDGVEMDDSLGGETTLTTETVRYDGPTTGSNVELPTRFVSRSCMSTAHNPGEVAWGYFVRAQSGTWINIYTNRYLRVSDLRAIE